MGRRKAVSCILCKDEQTYNENAVCDGCYGEWQRGRAFADVVHAGGDEENEIFRSVQYWYLYHFAVNPPKFDNNIKNELTRNLIALANAREINDNVRHWSQMIYPHDKDIPSMTVGQPENVNSSREYPLYYLAPKGTGERLQAIYEGIVLLLADAYRSGQRDGTSILSKLAKGEASIEDYNASFDRARKG